MIESEIIENIEVLADFNKKNLKSILHSAISTHFDQSTKKIFRVEISIPQTNILNWLNQQPHDQRIYWSERSGDYEVGGIGQADMVSDANKNNYSKAINHIYAHLSAENKNLRYFGGLQFQNRETSDDLWKSFRKFYFILPQFEILNLAGEFLFCCNIFLYSSNNKSKQIEQIFDEFDRLKFDEQTNFQTSDDFLKREDFPDKKGWAKSIQTALQIIDKNIVEKVVLARKVILTFNDTLNIYSLLKRIMVINPHATHFCLQLKQNLAFIGGSPELLYRRQNEHIYSEAIAGTRSRGKDEREDSRLERELLESDKERREHRFVVESIRESLFKLCEDLNTSKEISVIKLHRLQHLYSNFHGTLRDNITDIEILELLHPTPAVGGYPVEEALKQISALEPFHRGWYAAPVGWIGYNSAEFAVAIRSGLIDGNKMALFSGGGIVRGSDIKSEWQEIENKIANFLNALGLNGEKNS